MYYNIKKKEDGDLEEEEEQEDEEEEEYEDVEGEEGEDEEEEEDDELESVNCVNPEECWNIVYDGAYNNLIMSAETGNINNDGTDNIDDEIGICGCHAYSILGACELLQTGKGKKKHHRLLRPFEKASGKKIRLIKLRNPWGEGEWRGKWGDADHKNWTPILKKQLNHSEQEDGVFFMKFKDFCKYYDNFAISHYTPGFKISSFRYETIKNQLLNFTFRVQENGPYYFVLGQLKERFFKESEYEYSDCRLFISCKDDTDHSGNFVGAIQAADWHTWCKADCFVGKTYYVSIFTPWKSCSKQISFYTYGKEEIQLQKTDKSKMDFVHLTDVFREKAYSNPDEGFTTFEDSGQPNIHYKFEDTELGFGYFYFENNTETTQMTVTVKTTGINGVVWGKPFESEKSPMVIVPPGQYEVIHYTKRDAESGCDDFRLITSFIDVTESKINSLKTKSKKQPRLYNGQDIGCNLYTSGTKDNYVF